MKKTRVLRDLIAMRGARALVDRRPLLREQVFHRKETLLLLDLRPGKGRISPKQVPTRTVLQNSRYRCCYIFSAGKILKINSRVVWDGEGGERHRRTFKRKQSATGLLWIRVLKFLLYFVRL